MRKMDLTDICNYLKGFVIPQTPGGFASTIAEPFRHGLSDDELEIGISAFRSFLYKFYDKIAADKSRFTTAMSEKYIPGDYIRKYYPVLYDLADILFYLGLNGRLETIPKKTLVFDNADLSKISKMTKKRKLEMLHYLSDLGIHFIGIDFFTDADFTQTRALHITYEEDVFFVVGLKLISEAQANVKNNTRRLGNDINGLLRCDFYPLANVKPKALVVYLNEIANSMPPEIREWVIGMDRLLTDSGCKTSGGYSTFHGSATFDYIGRKSNKKVCRFIIGISGCSIEPKANLINNPNIILDELPENMLNILKNGSDCAGAHGTQCRIRLDFTHNGEKFHKCPFGFRFTMDNAAEREMFKKWIELELAGSNN